MSQYRTWSRESETLPTSFIALRREAITPSRQCFFPPSSFFPLFFALHDAVVSVFNKKLTRIFKIVLSELHMGSGFMLFLHCCKPTQHQSQFKTFIIIQSLTVRAFLRWVQGQLRAARDRARHPMRSNKCSIAIYIYVSMRRYVFFSVMCIYVCLSYIRI